MTQTTRKTKRIKETTDEDIAKINPDNINLMNKFIMYLNSTGTSPNTIKVYKSNMHIFLNWIRENEGNKDFSKVDETDIMMFQGQCLDSGMSSARIRNLRATISSMSNYIVKTLKKREPERFGDFENCVKYIDAPPHTPARKKTVLSEDDVNNLLSKLVEQERYQQACMVAVLISSGMRKSEAIQCKVDWFVGESVKISGGMYVSPEIRTKGRGREGKRLSKFFIQKLLDPYLKLWLEERERLGITHEDLFVRKIDGKWDSIQQSTVDSWMTMCSKVAGEVIYAHAFRHYVSTWLVRNGTEISKVKDFHGHAGVETTELYVDIDRSENIKDILGFLDE